MDCNPSATDGLPFARVDRFHQPRPTSVCSQMCTDPCQVGDLLQATTKRVAVDKPSKHNKSGQGTCKHSFSLLQHTRACKHSFSGASRQTQSESKVNRSSGKQAGYPCQQESPCRQQGQHDAATRSFPTWDARHQSKRTRRLRGFSVEAEKAATTTPLLQVRVYRLPHSRTRANMQGTPGQPCKESRGLRLHCRSNPCGNTDASATVPTMA